MTRPMCDFSWFYKIFTPEWLTAIGTVGTVVVALILALWAPEIRGWVASPKLSLRARVQRPDSERVERENKLDKTPMGTAYFFRLAIRNRGRIAADNVQVFLANVEKITNGTPTKMSAFTPMNLLWSYRASATLPTLLPEMPPVYCDMAHVEQPIHHRAPGILVNYPAGQQAAVLTLDVEFPSNMGGHVLDAGTYHFHLILAAANCPPRRYRLEVVFSGEWYPEEETMFKSGFQMRAI